MRGLGRVQVSACRCPCCPEAQSPGEAGWQSCELQVRCDVIGVACGRMGPAAEMEVLPLTVIGAFGQDLSVEERARLGVERAPVESTRRNLFARLEATALRWIASSQCSPG